MCPICKALHTQQYTWTFPAGEGVVTTELTHPEFGVVWTAMTGSLVHHTHKVQGACRCRLEPRVDMSDIQGQAWWVLGVLKNIVNQPEENPYK